MELMSQTVNKVNERTINLCSNSARDQSSISDQINMPQTGQIGRNDGNISIYFNYGLNKTYTYFLKTF